MVKTHSMSLTSKAQIYVESVHAIIIIIIRFVSQLLDNPYLGARMLFEYSTIAFLKLWKITINLINGDISLRFC